MIQGLVAKIGLKALFGKIPPWLWLVVIAAVVLLAFGFALKSYGKARYDAGVTTERAAWETKAAKIKAEAERLQRIADGLRREAEELDRARIARNRQEVDNALRNIPDRATSPRQHARACLELRRQGKNPAACQPQPAR